MAGWREEVRALFRLAFPVILIQVGLWGMGAVDSAFMGRVSAVEFAAVSIGHTWSFLFLAFGMGVLSVLDPVVGQAWGARDFTAVSRGLQRGICLALGLSVLVGLAIWPADLAFEVSRQQPEVVPIATAYARITIASVPAFLIFVALRQSMQAMHQLRPLVFLILSANLLNAFLDWVLIRGNLGVPALGAIGSAWGTVIARWAMLLAVPWIAGRDLSRFLWPLRSGLLVPRALGRMLWIGLPIGVQFVLEVGAFSSVAILMGKLGAAQLAGHQTALSLASASFMVPWGISMAASVRVGNEIGRGNAAAVKLASKVALIAGAGVMAVFGSAFLAAPLPLARVFTDLDEVLAVAVVLVPIAGLFQVFDGIQGVASGILRGMADTRFPMMVHVVGFWCLGIPFGAYLAFRGGSGAAGLWWGLVVGLGVVAGVQFLRLRHLLRRGVERLVIDDATG